MDLKRTSMLAKGYWFVARSTLAGKVTNTVLDLLALFDYRLLIVLSSWHPDMNSRIRLLKKRGVQVADTVWIDQGVWIEITTPQAVVIEDYAKIGYGAIIYAHDAAMNAYADLPMRVKTTRIGYSCAIGSGSVIMPGVTVEPYSGVLNGSVVTKDVKTGTIVAGNPAVVLGKVEDIGLMYQADIKVHPELYFDHPNPFRPPKTPYDDLITWRKEGVKIRDATELRTGTPFDYILDARAEGKGKGKGKD